MPASRRPQTLKQAKRAYQKTGPARPSASDIAQAERRAALQERADRIKEREARRKLNLKKRDEKIAKEREAAKKAGRPFLEEQKPLWKVGASQRRLGSFLNGIDQSVKPDLSKTWPERDIEGDTENIDPQEQPEPHQCQELSDLSTRPLSPSAATQSACIISEERFSVCSAHEMPPPPRPLPPKQPVILDEAFEDCFPSNTQIQRELSPESRKANICSPNRLHESSDAGQDTMDVNDFLACISTQDLNLSSSPVVSATFYSESDLLAQISTQDLDLEGLSPKTAVEAEFVDPEAVLAQISTQDLIFSQEPTELRRSANSDSFTDADFDDFFMQCETQGSGKMGPADPEVVCK